MAYVKPDVEHWLEQEIAQWVHHVKSVQQPIKPWALYYGATMNE